MKNTLLFLGMTVSSFSIAQPFGVYNCRAKLNQTTIPFELNVENENFTEITFFEDTQTPMGKILSSVSTGKVNVDNTNGVYNYEFDLSDYVEGPKSVEIQINQNFSSSTPDNLSVDINGTKYPQDMTSLICESEI